jgi:hypothetical protein
MWLIPMIANLEQEFLYWRRLHSFWRTLPNFNPHTVSSEPGQDLEGEAMAHMHGPTRSMESAEVREGEAEAEGGEDENSPDGTAGSFGGDSGGGDNYEVSIFMCPKHLF